jgi:hypothetical protein
MGKIEDRLRLLKKYEERGKRGRRRKENTEYRDFLKKV